MRNWSLYEMPAIYVNKEFEKFEDKAEGINMLEDFVLGKSSKWCWYLYGDPGAGKTHLVCHLLKKFLLSSFQLSARFLTPRTFHQKLQDCFHDNLAKHELIRRLSETDLLVFDDFGKAYDTDWKIEKVSDLIEDRYDSGKKTLITSNLSLDDFKKRTKDDRIYRRLAEGNVGEWTASKYLKLT